MDRENDVAELRAAVAAEVERTSLRAVAADAGMSPTGLRKLIDGSAPYTKTLRKLRAWVARRRRDAPDPEFEDALAVVLSRAAPKLREGIGETIRSLVGVEPGERRRELPPTVRCAECRRDIPRGEYPSHRKEHRESER
jgi:hypothetical protein